MEQAGLSMVVSSVTQFPHLENRVFWDSLKEILGFSPHPSSRGWGWISEGLAIACGKMAMVPRDTPMAHPLSQAIPLDVQWHLERWH